MDNSISGNVRRRSLDKHKKSSDDSVCNEQCSLSIPVQGVFSVGLFAMRSVDCGVSICTFAHSHICWVSICTSVASVLSFGTHSHVGGDLYFYTWAPPIKVFTAELWSDMKRPKTPMGLSFVKIWVYWSVMLKCQCCCSFLLQRLHLLVFILSICARLDFWKVSKCETENKPFSGLVTLLATRSYTVPVSAWQLNRENCKSDFLPIFTTHLKVLLLITSLLSCHKDTLSKEHSSVKITSESFYVIQLVFAPFKSCLGESTVAPIFLSNHVLQFCNICCYFQPQLKFRSWIFLHGVTAVSSSCCIGLICAFDVYLCFLIRPPSTAPPSLGTA